VIFLSWNVRGLNTIPRKKFVHSLIESQSPNVDFIQETKHTMDGLANCASCIWPQGSWKGVGSLNSLGGFSFL
jgi:exonuclease III